LSTTRTAEAERIRARYRSQDQQVASDRDLTELARRSRRDQLKAEAREAMAETRRGYKCGLRDLELEAKRAAFGAAPPPSRPSSLAAWRDSVDRGRTSQARPRAGARDDALRRSVRRSRVFLIAGYPRYTGQGQ
jgi:hypothetical protein